jgi:hypothetical protein
MEGSKMGDGWSGLNRITPLLFLMERSFITINGHDRHQGQVLATRLGMATGGKQDAVKGGLAKQGSRQQGHADSNQGQVVNQGSGRGCSNPPIQCNLVLLGLLVKRVVACCPLSSTFF